MARSLHANAAAVRLCQTRAMVRDRQDAAREDDTVREVLAQSRVIAVVGATVVILGIIMFVTPGPGLIVTPIGLAILSLEFAWARLWLRKLRRVISNNSLTGRAKRAQDHQDRAVG